MATSSSTIKVLIASDSSEQALHLVKTIANGGYLVDYLRVDSALSIKQSATEHWDLLIADIHLAQLAEQGFFKSIGLMNLSIPLILLCDEGEEIDIAVNALNIGAKGVFPPSKFGVIIDTLNKVVDDSQHRVESESNAEDWTNLPLAGVITNSQWQIVKANTLATKLLDETLETSLFDCWSGSSKTMVSQLCKSFAIGYEPYLSIGTIDEPLELATDGRHFFRLKIHRLSSHQSTQYHAFFEDITNDIILYNRFLDQQTKLKEQYSSALSSLAETQKRDTDTLIAKTQFLSQVSHEIRTPMNAISGFAESLNKLSLDPEAKALTTRISRASSLLLSVVNDLLDFSKLESNQFHIQQEAFFLNDVLDDLAFIMGGSAKSKNLEFTIMGPPQELTYLEGDDLRLKQVFINLAANAIKFTEKGSVTFDIKTIKRERDHISFKFSIKDTGIGMTSDQVNKIMQPYVQANMDISRRYGGTGLGLSICRSLIEKMGGELKVTSIPDEGSTFYFELTFKLLPYPSNKLQKLSGVKVLIADDNPIALKGLETSVASMNWLPTTFYSGESLIKGLVEHVEWQGPHCIVLLDWKMPEMDGVATAQKIHKLLPEDKRPLIFLVTSKDSDTLIELEKSQHIDQILDKPVLPAALYQAVIDNIKERSPQILSDNPIDRLLNCNILVVEDSDLNLDLIRSLLEESGAIVHVAMNGQKAIDMMMEQSDTVDLVLLDIQLPDFDGFEVARKLREHFDASALPILAMSARIGIEDKELAKQAGMNDWISKPINRERLFATIEQYMHRQPSSELVKSEHLSSHEVNSRFSKLRWDNLPVINSKSNHIVTQQKDVYHRLLHKFISANLPALQLLEAGTMSEEKIFKLAHKLRGGSLSLGLEKLSELCLMFEEFSANKTKQHPSFDDLTRTLRQSIDTINSMLRDTTTKKVINNPSQDMTDEALTSCFKFGLKVLSSHSLQEVKPFLEQLQSYGLEQIYRDVEHQLDDFDFSGAARVIKTAAKVKGLDLD